MNLGTLLITLGVDTAGLNKGYDAIQKFRQGTVREIDAVSASLERSSNEFQRFGSAATTYLTLPLMAVGGGALKMSSDLEYANQKIVALAGVSQAQVDAWALAESRLSEQTATSQVKIAETLYYVASAGIEAKEAMEITEVSAKAAMMGLGEMDTMGRLLTYAINAYGKENITAMEAADALTIAVREGTAEASTMVNVIGDLIPVASALGVEFGEVTGSVAAMTRTGFNAYKSATSLRQIMVSLLNPTVEAEHALESWSKKLNDATYSAEGLRRTMREKGLFEALIKVDELVKQFGPEAAGIVFGNVRALTGDLSLTGKNIDKVREVLEATRNESGAFQYAFEVMSQTVTVHANQLKVALGNSFVALGQAMLPAVLPILRDLIDMVQNLTNWIKSLNPATIEWVMKLGLLLMALGPVMKIIAAGIKIFAGLRAAMLFAGEAAVVLYGYLQALAAMAIANPLGAAAVVLAAFAAQALVAANAAKQLTDAQKAVQDVELQAAQAVVNERVEIEKLLRVVQSQTASQEMKETAIARLNAISPQYLGYIDEEAIKTGTAKKAIDEYISSLERKARVQAATELLKEKEKQKLAIEMEPPSNKMSFGQIMEEQWWGITHPFADYWEKQNHRIQYKANETQKKIESLNQSTEFLQEIITQNTETPDMFDALETKLQTINSTMAGFSNKQLQVGDYVNLAEAQKSVNKLITEEEEYTKFLDNEYNKRLAADEEYQSIKKRYSSAWQADASQETLQAIQTELFARRDMLTKDLQDKEKYTQDSINLLNNYATQIDAMIKGLPKADPIGDSKETEDKIKTFKQRLNAIMEAMRSAQGEHLNSLADEYIALSKILEKQEQLIAVTLARKEAAYDIANPRVKEEYDSSGIPIKRGLGVEMDLDVEKLKKATEYLNTLKDAGIYAGQEVDKVTASIIQLNSHMIENTFSKTLQEIGVQSSLLGSSFNNVSAEIEANRQAIDDLTKQYNAALEIQDYVLSNQIRQSIGIKNHSIATLTLVEAEKKLKTELQNIANFENILGKEYDETSEKIRAQRTYLDTLIQSLNSSVFSFEELTKLLALIANTKVNIKLLEIKKITEDYNEAIKENNLQEAIFGRYHNEKLGKLQAEINKYTALIKLQKEGSAEYKITLEKLKELNDEYEREDRKERKKDNAFRSIIQDVQGLIDKMAEASGMSKQLTGAINNIGKGFAQGGVIGGVAAAFIEGINALVDLDLQKLKDIEVQKEMNIAQREYNILLNEQSKIEQGRNVFIQDNIAAITRMTTAVNKSKEEMQKALTYTFLLPNPNGAPFEVTAQFDTLKELLDEMIVWERKVRGDGLFGWGSHNEYQSILAKYPELYDAATGRLNVFVAEALLANDNLWQGQAANGKAWLEQVTAWSKQYEENIKDLTDALADLVGSMGNDMFAAVSEAWDKGEDAFAAYEIAVSKGLDNIMKQMIWNAVMAADLLQLQNELAISFDPLKGDMDPSDDFDRFLDRTAGKIGLVTKGWDEWRAKAEARGFKFPEEEDSSDSAIGSSNIARRIAEGIEKGYKTGIKTISVPGYTSQLATLGGFSEIFGDLIYETVMENFTKAITDSAGMKLFNEYLASYTSAGSEGGTQLTQNEIDYLDYLLASVAQTGVANFEALKPIIDKYKTISEDGEGPFKAADIAQGIINGIDEGLQLGNDSLGGFAKGFGELIKSHLSKGIIAALEEQINAGFLAKFSEYIGVDSDGGVTLTAAELAELEKLYIAAVAAGQDSMNAIKPILDKYNIGDKAQEETKKLFDADSIADTIFDGIDKGFKLGQNSLGDFAEGFQSLMKKALTETLRGNMVNQLTTGFLAKYEEYIGAGSEGGSELTSNEILVLEQLYATAIKEGTTAFQAVKPILDKYSETAKDQMTAAVKGMTVDQASLLAGQMTALRYGMQDMVDSNKRIEAVENNNNAIHFQALAQLKDISANTKKTNDVLLPELVDAVKETNRLITTLWQ